MIAVGGNIVKRFAFGLFLLFAALFAEITVSDKFLADLGKIILLCRDVE